MKIPKQSDQEFLLSKRQEIERSKLNRGRQSFPQFFIVFFFLLSSINTSQDPLYFTERTFPTFGPSPWWRLPPVAGDSALKIGRRELPSSIPGHACRLSRSEFSVVFSETRVNTGQDPPVRPPTEGTPPAGPGPTKRTVGLNPITQPNPILVQTTDTGVILFRNFKKISSKI